MNPEDPATETPTSVESQSQNIAQALLSDIKNLTKDIPLATMEVPPEIIQSSSQAISELEPDLRKEIVDSYLSGTLFSNTDASKFDQGVLIKAIVNSSYEEITEAAIASYTKEPLDVDHDTILRFEMLVAAGFDPTEAAERLTPEQIAALTEYDRLHVERGDLSRLAVKNLLHGLPANIHAISEMALRLEAEENDLPRLRAILEGYVRHDTLGGRESNFSAEEPFREMAFFLAHEDTKQGIVPSEVILDFVMDSYHKHDHFRLMAIVSSNTEVFSDEKILKIYKPLEEKDPSYLFSGITSAVIDGHYEIKEGTPLANILQDNRNNFGTERAFMLYTDAIVHNSQEYLQNPILKPILEREINQVTPDLSISGLEKIILVCTAQKIEIPDAIKSFIEKNPQIFKDKKLISGDVQASYTNEFKEYVPVDDKWIDLFYKEGYAALPQSIRNMFTQEELFNPDNVSSRVLQHITSGYKKLYPETPDLIHAEEILREHAQATRDSMHPDVIHLLKSIDPNSLYSCVDNVTRQNEGKLTFSLLSIKSEKLLVPLSITDVLPEEVITSVRGKLSQTTDLEKIDGKYQALLMFADEEVLSKFSAEQQRVIALMKEYPEDQKLIFGTRDAIYKIPQEKIQEYFSILKKIAESPIPEVIKIRDELIVSVLRHPTPDTVYEDVLNIFAKNNLPEVGKVMKVFQTLYPIDIIVKKISIPGHYSPTLTRYVNEYSRLKDIDPNKAKLVEKQIYGIFYADSLKANIESHNESLRSYLTEMKKAIPILSQVESDPSILDRDPELEASFKVAVNRLTTLYGAATDRTSPQGGTALERLSSLKEVLGVSDNESLDTWFKQSYLAPLNYESIDEILLDMDLVRSRADERNREQIITTSEGKRRIELHENDLLKGIYKNYFDSYMNNGFMCPELLGAHSGTDGTPFDVDAARVRNFDLVGDNPTQNAIDKSMARGYGQAMVVMRPNDGAQDNKGSDRYRADKKEVFAITDPHTGIRSGIGWYEIQAIVAKKKEDVPFLAFYITQKEAFIPIVDLDGNVLYDIEDFERDREKLKTIDDINLRGVARASGDIDGRSVISVMRGSAYLNELFEKQTGTGGTLGEHTTYVEDNYDKYFAEHNSKLITRNEMRILFGLHDIGKPVGTDLENSPLAQHKYTQIIAPRVLEAAGITGQKATLIMKIISSDILGEYLQGNKDVNASRERLIHDAEYLGVTPKEYYDLLEVYYLCDAGAYTSFSSGNSLLDSEFVVTDNSLSFGMRFKNKTDDLLASL